MNTFRFGTVPYAAACTLQAQLVRARIAGEVGDVVLILEHPPTITLGRGASPRHVLASPEQLSAMGVVLTETDRGGDVTFHGPGQVIAYPIVNLKELRPDINWYLRTLEGSLIETCRFFGVDAERFPPHTGVWVGRRKIAAIGIKVTRWVTSHGIALNVRNMQEWFRLIIPCGLAEYSVTSLEEEREHAPSFDVVIEVLAHSLRRQLTGSGASAANKTDKKTVTKLVEALDIPAPVLLEC